MVGGLLWGCEGQIIPGGDVRLGTTVESPGRSATNGSGGRAGGNGGTAISPGATGGAGILAGSSGGSSSGGSGSGTVGSVGGGGAPGKVVVPAGGGQGGLIPHDSGTAGQGQGGESIWHPAPGTTWQWQLTGTIDESVDAQMFDLDLFDAPVSTIARLRARGHQVVCYFSAGSFENWRPDAAQFPAAVKGAGVVGWPGEQWLDVRKVAALAPVMEARLDLCRSKGFGGVELDNVDAYNNPSGFPITAADQLVYNRALAAAAHARGLSVGLKNDLDQVAVLVNDFDWALNEECFAFNECAALQPFIRARKAVFTVEYNLAPASFCPQAKSMGFSSLYKKLNLDAFRTVCP